MPYKSLAQEGYFHTHKAQLEKQGVNISEWDKSTKGRHLPNKVGSKQKTQKHMAESKHNHPHPFKHTHAHDANSMEHIVEHHPNKLSMAHPSHPGNKDFKAATENVQHAGGHTGKMEVKGM